MTDKCEFCEGTKIDPVAGGACTWCDGTGIKTGLFTAPVAVVETLTEAITHGVGVMQVSAEGVEHVPLTDVLVDLKPFRLLPYGTKFRYRGTTDAWVRIGNNLIAAWPATLFGSDGTPCQSLCIFCHLEGDEDGNTLDTLVEVVDHESELAALREELAQVKGHRAKMFDIKESYRQRMTAAEQRNAELVELLTDAYGAIDENDGWKQLCARILAVIQPAKLREFIATQPRKSSDSYLPANTVGMLSGVTYVNTRDCAAMVSVSGGSLFVDGHQVPSPCLIPPGATARAERGPEYTNFFAAMNYVTVTELPSIENWVEVKP